MVDNCITESYSLIVPRRGGVRVGLLLGNLKVAKVTAFEFKYCALLITQLRSLVVSAFGAKLSPCA